jgi:DNA-binding transcriptional regulator YiaG
MTHPMKLTLPLDPSALAAPRRHRPRDPRSVRRALRLSQEDFAQALGVSRSTVLRWEASRKGPDEDSAAGRLLNVMGEIADVAARLWGPDEIRQWLESPAPAFRGRRPLDVLAKDGPLPVRDLLLSAANGGYS